MEFNVSISCQLLHFSVVKINIVRLATHNQIVKLKVFLPKLIIPVNVAIVLMLQPID